jgi:hypothetical protein
MAEEYLPARTHLAWRTVDMTFQPAFFWLGI